MNIYKVALVEMLHVLVLDYITTLNNVKTCTIVFWLSCPVKFSLTSVKQGQARSSNVKQGQARSSKAKQGQARSNKVKQGQARPSRVKHGQARSSKVK